MSKWTPLIQLLPHAPTFLIAGWAVQKSGDDAVDCYKFALGVIGGIAAISFMLTFFNS
jgi:hypothetical protein